MIKSAIALLALSMALPAFAEGTTIATDPATSAYPEGFSRAFGVEIGKELSGDVQVLREMTLPSGVLGSKIIPPTPNEMFEDYAVFHSSVDGTVYQVTAFGPLETEEVCNLKLDRLKKILVAKYPSLDLIPRQSFDPVDVWLRSPEGMHDVEVLAACDNLSDEKSFWDNVFGGGDFALRIRYVDIEARFASKTATEDSLPLSDAAEGL